MEAGEISPRIKNTQESSQAHTGQSQNETQSLRKPEQSQKRQRKSKEPYGRKADWMLAVDRTKGLTEEQIRLSDEAVDKRIKMLQEGKSPEEIRKMLDEYRLKQYPGLTLEEANKKEEERMDKIAEEHDIR